MNASSMVNDAPHASVDDAAWHAQLRRLHRYWLGLCRPDGRLPGRQHLDPLAIPDLLPQLWMLDVQREPFRLRYRLVGTKVDLIAGISMTGRWMDEVHPHVYTIPGGMARLQGVVETHVPSWRRGPPLFWLDRIAEIENVVLPLASDGVAVDVLLVQTRFFASDGREV
jgi:hypothetical protein